MSHAALDERHVMRRFDADDGKELHEKPGRLDVVLHDGVVVGHVQVFGSVMGAFLVFVRRLQAHLAESRARQAGVVEVEAFAALETGHFSAHYALSGCCNKFEL